MYDSNVDSEVIVISLFGIMYLISDLNMQSITTLNYVNPKFALLQLSESVMLGFGEGFLHRGKVCSWEGFHCNVKLSVCV